MFFLSRLYRHPAFVQGMREVSPQSPGIAAWGLMTGVAMVKSGMSVFEASAMTLLVFAGSSQLAAIPLLVAGAPAWVIFRYGRRCRLNTTKRKLTQKPVAKITQAGAVAMVKSGMSVFEASAMTLLVFAGSSQLAAIPLIVAGAPEKRASAG